VLRQIPAVLVEALLAGLVAAFFQYREQQQYHYHFNWTMVVVPVCSVLLIHPFMIANVWTPPTVSWDQEGIRIDEETKSTFLPWSDFEEYRFTWGIVPHLKLRRWSSQWNAVRVNLAGFDEDQRAALMRELDLHSGQVPPAERAARALPTGEDY